jgi:hypothetical protein
MVPSVGPAKEGFPSKLSLVWRKPWSAYFAGLGLSPAGSCIRLA